MRKFLLGSIVFLGMFTGPAMAADLPVKAPAYETPVAAPIYNWTGFYVGVNGGGGWGRSRSDIIFDPSSSSSTAAPGSASRAIDGALGGLQAGYNLQTSSFLFGLETDIQATGQNSDALSTITQTTLGGCLAPCVPPPPTVTHATLDYAQKLPWFGTLRGRIGVAADHWLVYATGGLAYGEIKTDAVFTVPGGACIAPCTPTPGGSVAGNFSQTKTGWVAGAGVEAALGGGWTGKVEYLHVDFGDIDNTFARITTFPFVGILRATSRVTDEIVRVGVNYRFGNAVVAKY
ncbi:outer membrane immunogenic protein [Bradyrhizobium erythrophlei]|jgi:outer membrane immunogenic protein|nr:outer membrane immunogenic protein [Bradyrhizobium erythrophlei]